MTAAGRAKTGERREQILQEALKLFVRDGVNAVTTRQIARAVGISQPSIYAHFKSADEIALVLCERGFEKLTERLTVAVAQDQDPLAKLRRICREYILFGLEHPDVYRVSLMLEKPYSDPADVEIALNAGLRGFGILFDLIKRLLGDEERSALVAQSQWAALHGLVSLLLARSEFPWADRARLIETHLDRLCADFAGKA